MKAGSTTRAFVAIQVNVHLAQVRGPVMDRLADTDLPRQLAHPPFLSLHQAIAVLAPASAPAAASAPHPPEPIPDRSKA